MKINAITSILELAERTNSYNSSFIQSLAFFGSTKEAFSYDLNHDLSERIKTFLSQLNNEEYLSEREILYNSIKEFEIHDLAFG